MNSIRLPKYVSLITLLAFGYVSQGQAQSPQDPRLARLAELADAEGCVFPDMPDIPDAAAATMEQMVGTQGAVQVYMADSTTLLECLEGIGENDDFSTEDRELALSAYNSVVENQETLVETWNAQRTSFLEAQQ